MYLKMKEGVSVDETESCRKLAGENRHLKTEKKKSWGKHKKEIPYRLVDGQNSWRRCKEVPERRREWGDGARPLTSDYTEPPPPPSSPSYSPPQGMGTREQQAGSVCVCVSVCVYVYMNVCVCAPCLFQHIVPSNTKR